MADAITAEIGRIDPSNMFTTEDTVRYQVVGPGRPDPLHNPWIRWGITLALARGFPPPQHPLP